MLERAYRLTPEYAGGFFDGEGCVRIVSRNGIPTHITVNVVNSNRQVLELLCDQYGGSVRSRKRYANHHSQTYAWQLTTDQARIFLEEIYPYTIVKQGVIEVAIEFHDTRRRGTRLGVPESEVQRRRTYADKLARLQGVARRVTP